MSDYMHRKPRNTFEKKRRVMGWSGINKCLGGNFATITIVIYSTAGSVGLITIIGVIKYVVVYCGREKGLMLKISICFIIKTSLKYIFRIVDGEVFV